MAKVLFINPAIREEVDPEFVSCVLDVIHHILGTMPPNVAIVRELHIEPFGAVDVLHVPRDAEVEAKATDQRAAVARIDVKATFGRESLFAIQKAAVLPVYIQRKHLPCRVGKPIQLLHRNKWSGGCQMNSPRIITRCHTEDRRPVIIFLVNFF